MSEKTKLPASVPVGPEDLVVLPKLAKHIVRYLERNDADPEKLLNVIALDPSLSVRLIGLAHAKRPAIPPVCMAEAANVLTLSKVIEIAARHSATTAITERDDTVVTAMWRHSVFVAHIAKELATRFDNMQPAWAFTAGLIHDIGRSTIYRLLSVDYMELYIKALDERGQLKDFEFSELGFDHAKVGEDIAQRLSLPKALSAVIRYHHQPFEAGRVSPEFVPICAVVSLANLLSHRLGNNLDFSEDDRREEAPLCEFLKLSDKRLGLLINFNVPQLIQGIRRYVNRF